MGENSYQPRTRQFDERPITRLQENFMAGMFSDIPASSVPDNGVVYLNNFINNGDRLTGRYGSRVWGDYATSVPGADLPVISNLVNQYTTEINNGVRTVNLFNVINYTVTESDVGRFFKLASVGWEEIIEVINSTSFITKSGDNPQGPNSFGIFRDKVNGVYFHNSQKKIILHIGAKIYISDVCVAEWKEINAGTVELIPDTLSTCDEYDNKVVLFTGAGLYSFDLSKQAGDIFYYKINSQNPIYGFNTNTVDLDVLDGPMAREYLYSLSKYDVTDINEANKLKNLPILESGSNSFQTGRSDVWPAYTTDYDLKTEEEEFSEVDIFVGRDMCTPVKTVEDMSVLESQWDTYTVYSTANVSKQAMDVQTGIGNQRAMFTYSQDIPVVNPYRLVVSSVTKGVSEFNHKVTFEVQGGSISGMDKAGRLRLKGVAVGSESRTYVNTSFGISNVDGDFVDILVPIASPYLQFDKIDITTTDPFDLLDGTYTQIKNNQYRGSFNFYLTFINHEGSGYWGISDGPPFILPGESYEPSIDDFIYITEANANLEDNPVFFEVGGVGEATSEFTRGSNVFINGSDKTEFVGTIGYGDSAMVTITPSSNFSYVNISQSTDSRAQYNTSIDLEEFSLEGSLFSNGFNFFGFPENIVKGSRLFLIDGTIVHVKRRLTNTSLEIYEKFEEFISDVVIGFPLYKKWDTETEDWMDLTPIELHEQNSRTYFDTNPERIVKDRGAAFPLYNRYFLELPNSSVGKIVPGFLFCSNPGDNTVNYCSIAGGFEYKIGYHHPAYQFLKLKDDFVGIGEVPDSLVVFGKNSTTTVPLNLTREESNPEVGSVVQVISGQTVADKNVGAIKHAGIQESEKGKLVVLTNEPAIRVFDGQKYSSSISSMRISKILKNIKNTVVSAYSTLTGYLFWMDE